MSAATGQPELHDETENGEHRPCTEEEPIRGDAADIGDVAAQRDRIPGRPEDGRADHQSADDSGRDREGQALDEARE